METTLAVLGQRRRYPAWRGAGETPVGYKITTNHRTRNMPSESNSNRSPAFYVRNALLVTVVLLVCTIAYDQFVLVPNGNRAVDRAIVEFNTAGMNRSSIHKAIGSQPASSENIAEFRIENWQYGGIFPLLDGCKFSTICRDSDVIEVVRGGVTDADRELYRDPNLVLPNPRN